MAANEFVSSAFCPGAAGTAGVPNAIGVYLDSTNSTTIGGTVAGAAGLVEVYHLE